MASWNGRGAMSGMTGKVSHNRKYVQLSVQHVNRLLHVFNVGHFLATPDTWEMDQDINVAIRQLLEKAENTPGARICLAHAVSRGSGNNRGNA